MELASGSDQGSEALIVVIGAPPGVLASKIDNLFSLN
jgi:hypothetical protein